MARSPRFHRLPNDTDFLVELEKLRRMTTQAHGVTKIGGPVYSALSGLLDAIDGVAGAITGDREFLWSGDPNKASRWSRHSE